MKNQKTDSKTHLLKCKCVNLLKISNNDIKQFVLLLRKGVSTKK